MARGPSPQQRKIGRRGQRQYIGQPSHGVVVTDPAGNQTVLPFTGDSGAVLAADGTFVVGGGGTEALDAKQDLLIWDEVLGAYLIDR